MGTAGIQTNGDAEAAIVNLQGKLQAGIALQKGSEVNPPDTFRLLFEPTFWSITTAGTG